MAESAIFDIEKYEIYVGGLEWHPKDALKSLDIRLAPIGIASEPIGIASKFKMAENCHL